MKNVKTSIQPRAQAATIEPVLFKSCLTFVYFCMVSSLCLWIVEAEAQLSVDITRGYVAPLPIAVPDFVGRQPDEQVIGSDIAKVIADNLERSGLFNPLDKSAFIQDSHSLQAGVRYGDWRLINAQALVSGRVQIQDDGRLRVEVRLVDVYAEEQMIGFALENVKTAWRRIAHYASDQIYKRLTGEDGYFNSRIVYVSESGPQNHRRRRLAIMDQDGFGHRFLTNGRYDVFTPRFSPNRREITYLSYEGKVPRVYLLSLDTGQREVLGNFPGMTFAPRFTPDGETVLLSLAKEGNSDIFAMDLQTRQTRKLTSSTAIDTSPSASPDGKFIVFNSDRGGSQQLYVMERDGTNVERISFGKGRYGTPVWSPRGDLIAFTRIHRGSFYIGVMRPDGTGERMLSSAYHVEGPTWSPNGRVLSFYKQTPADDKGRFTSKLYSIDLTGYNEREVITPLDGTDPAWSPLLQ